MRNKTSQFFEVKYRYDKTMDNGTQKKVTELYVVEALSFSEAEEEIIKHMAAYHQQSDADIKAIAIAPYKEVLLSQEEQDDRYYKTKLAFITLDERTDKEIKKSFIYLVQASSTAQAEKYVKEMLSKTMIDYTVQEIKETQIMDLFEW